MPKNRISQLFGIRYPIISGGMVWCSGYELAAAVSNAGGLGLIGSGSMHPEVLRDHIRKVKAATDKPFGVNVPLMFNKSDENMQVILEEHVPVVFTSAGSPKKWTQTLHNSGIKVAHVVSSSKFALKSQDAGVDAVVAEGFEAGGHNGAEETTTLCLIPPVVDAVEIPVMAAGGIGSGQAMAAMMALGAEGVQIGTLFALSQESSAHEDFKKLCISLTEGETKLLFKKVSPTRLVKGAYMDLIKAAEDRGADAEELKEIRGFGRSRMGIFEGNLAEGELEIGQVSASIHKIEPIATIMDRLIHEFHSARQSLSEIDF